MPSPPPRNRGSGAGSHPNSPPNSRPGTPLSHSSGAPFSRPASTFIDCSRPPSRPQSIVLHGSTDLDPSTPTLRVIPPPDLINPWDPDQQQQPKENGRYHILTSEEMDMLCRPPPLRPPMVPSPLASSPETKSPLKEERRHSKELSTPQPLKRQSHGPRDDSDDDKGNPKPGCCGLCEVGTAKCVGGTFAAWAIGTVMPITFGVVMGCVSKMFK
ncbi:hypothetical protein VTI74DRAFT_11020 [Chaetomium olivicolor]